MKNFLRTTLTTFAVGLLALMPPAVASTPDGETPAEETVCDVLKDDGVTKGLYGLCVAFCEAQDYATISDPITEEEYEAITESAPAGRILENYNKKKDKANNPNDPEMPCIVIEEPCPCWTSAELTKVAEAYDASHAGDLCRYSEPPSTHNLNSIREQSPDLLLARTLDHQHNIPGGEGRDATCRYIDRTVSPIISRGSRLNAEEWKACSTAIRDRQLDYNMTCQEVN